MRLQHAQKAEVLADIVDHEAQQKTVIERGQLFFFGQFVAGAEKGQERHFDDLFAIVKQPLVDQRQYRIQDRRVGFEDLVQKGNMRFRQFTVGDPAVVVLLQGLETHRAEDLLGRGEAGEQPLKVIRPLDAPAQLVGEHGLGRAGRADDQQMLRRQQCRQSAVDQVAALEEHLF